jgi:hypothetical protein
MVADGWDPSDKDIVADDSATSPVASASKRTGAYGPIITPNGVSGMSYNPERDSESEV